MAFEGKRVLVTGAGSGIGLAIAEAYTVQGARVFINDLTQDIVDTALKNLGPTARGHAGDIGHEATVKAMITAAQETLGGLDIVISNAGLYPSQPFLEMETMEWDRVMNTNARGTFLVCREAARYMSEAGQGGAIITISSGSARFARVGAAHYCASKAAIVMLTRVMALELAPHNIRVNSVAPGIIDVPGGQPLTDEYKQAMTNMIPSGRMGTPQDVADVVLFVSGPHADYINGQIIPVDGGLSSGRYGIPASG